MKDYYTLEEFAAAVGVSKLTIHLWIRSGRIKPAIPGTQGGVAGTGHKFSKEQLEKVKRNRDELKRLRKEKF